MKRHKLHKIALMVFFLLYAVSPLTYDVSTKSSTSDLSRGTSKRTLREASLYLIEVLYVAFSGPEKRENGPAPNPLLITKKSAVLRGRFDLVPQSDRIAAFVPSDPTARHYFNIEDERVEIMRSWLRRSYACLRLSSGISPPLLS